MWLSIDLDFLSDLIEQSRFEFTVWLWTMILMLAFALVMIGIEHIKSRRRTIRLSEHFNDGDPRWGHRR